MAGGRRTSLAEDWISLMMYIQGGFSFMYDFFPLIMESSRLCNEKKMSPWSSQSTVWYNEVNRGHCKSRIHHMLVLGG
jgi:hypothetical protein